MGGREETEGQSGFKTPDGDNSKPPALQIFVSSASRLPDDKTYQMWCGLPGGGKEFGFTVNAGESERTIREYYASTFEWMVKFQGEVVATDLARDPTTRHGFVERMTAQAMEHILTRAQTHFFFMLWALVAEVHLYEQVFLYKLGDITKAADKSILPSANELLGLMGEVSKMHVNSLNLPRAGTRAPRFSMVGLNFHHWRRLPEVRDAKNIYKRNRDRPDWQSIVKAIHPEMPPDLIARLSSTDADLRRDQYIALEWAARLCGAPPNSYSGRQLDRRLKRGPDEEFKEIVRASRREK
jgi:hypothetical protein